MTHPMHRAVSALLLCTVTGAQAITVQIQVWSPAYCINPTGALYAAASGGVGPYTYAWNTGATTADIGGLTAGTYSVTVTDFNSDEATAEVTLTSEPYPPLYPTWLPGCPDNVPLGGPAYRLISEAYPSNSGFPPYNYSDPNAMTLTDQGYMFHYFGMFPFLPAGSPVSVVVTDANGCATTMNTIVPPVPQLLEPQVLEVNGACSGGSNGSIRVFLPAEPNGWQSGFYLYGSNGSQWGANDQVGLGPVDQTYAGLPAGTYHMVIKPSWAMMVPPGWQEQWFPWLGEDCPDTTTVVVPDLGFTCGTLSGRVYVDANENCVQGGGEPGLPNTVVEVQPGNYYTLTNNSGNYSINLPYGTYTVMDQNPQFQEHCGVQGTPFDISLAQPNVTRNLADTSLAGLDVRVGVGSGAARPGFQVNYGVLVQNLTGVLSGAGTVSFTFQAPLTYVQATPAPTSINGTTLTWNMTSLGAFQQRNYSISLQVPPDIGLLGTELAATATVSVANTDVDLSNNTDTHLVTVTGAYDPNDKLASTTSGLSGQYLLDTDDEITYTIRFQNTGTDTAFFVVITDTLPPTVDPATFRAGPASHTHSVTMQGNGVLRWMFPNILLPDSNVNEPQSHGFVTFHIRPHLPIPPGTVIGNIANIYFDYNPPVITEPSVLTATVPPLLLDVRALLKGPYVAATVTMSDALRSAALLPTTEPYTALGYTFAGSGGGETSTPAVLSEAGPDAVVDWVLLELRDALAPTTVLHSRAALLVRDGRVLEVDGGSAVRFFAEEGAYHVAIRHRNHLGCMTAAPVLLQQVMTTVDLSDPATATWGTEAREAVDDRMLLWPGDANFDGHVKYTNTGNDRDEVLQAIGGSIPTHVVQGYGGTDITMDGNMKYVGAGNDRDIILQTIGGSVPTAVRSQQLP